jgi:hypothetical protein
MGQNWVVVNLDKREMLDPLKFDDGMKLAEFGYSSRGTLTGLTMLLADPNGVGRGGGDMRVSGPMVGRWFGDRIAIAGDYGDPVDEFGRGLYQVALGRPPKAGPIGVLDWRPGGTPEPEPAFTDISEDVVQTLMSSRHFGDRDRFKERFERRMRDK